MLYHRGMKKEKLTTFTIRAYFLLSCYRTCYFRGHKKYEQSLIITLTNSGGYIEFELIDSSTNETNKLENPESGVYEFPLKKGVMTKLIIRAKGAKGKYKIQKKTIKE